LSASGSGGEGHGFGVGVVQDLHFPVLVDIEADYADREVPGLQGLDAFHDLGDLGVPGHGVAGAVVVTGEGHYAGPVAEDGDTEVVLDIGEIGLHLLGQYPVGSGLGDVVHVVHAEIVLDPMDHGQLYPAVDAVYGGRIGERHESSKRKKAHIE